MSELSPWFKRDDFPVRDGYYEVEYWNYHREMREWRGGYWMFRQDDETAFHFPSTYIRKWRGEAR